MGKLFDRITDYENLRQSAWEVFRGKRGKVSANALFYDLEPRLLELQRDLRVGAYQHGPYRHFDILDPKPRTISAATLRDRVVHHAVVRVLEPRFERRFIHHSYACRTGKGHHRALRQFVRWARGHRYTMVLDVRQFFPSIDHEVIKAVAFEVVRDPEVRALLGHIIDASDLPSMPAHFPGDDLLTPLERRTGLPIGNLTSQFLANVLLNEVDHHVKDRLRVKGYLRYADDLAFFGDDKAALWALRDAVEAKLFALRLRLNRAKSRVRRLKEGVTFLGFTVLPTTVRLGPIAVRRARRRMRALQAEYAAGAPWADVHASLQAWSAHANHGDTHRLRAAAFAARPFRRARRSRGNVRPHLAIGSAVDAASASAASAASHLEPAWRPRAGCRAASAPRARSRAARSGGPSRITAFARNHGGVRAAFPRERQFSPAIDPGSRSRVAAAERRAPRTVTSASAWMISG